MTSNARSTVLGAFFIALLAMPAHLLYAACTVTLGVSNVNITWNLSFSYQQVNFTVTKTSDPACDYGIAFTKGGASNYTRRMTNVSNVPFYYQLYKDSNFSYVLKDAGDITSNNDVFLGHFDAGTVAAQSFSYYVQLPLGLATSPALKPFGGYSDTFNVRAFEGTDPTQFSSPIATNSVTLTTTVPRIAELSIGNTGDTFDATHLANTVNFGTLTTGIVGQRDLLVRTNAGYSISISSANNGSMIHSNPAITTKVPYAFFLSASPITLSTPAAGAVTATGQTSLEGDRYPILIRVGDISHGLAGNYSDTITISVSTTD